ncbi:hypothetical protein [Fibrobacter sp.]
MNNEPIENPNQTQSASNDPSFVEQVLNSIGDHAIDAAGEVAGGIIGGFLDGL